MSDGAEIESSQVVAFLRDHAIARELDDAQLSLLAGVAELRTFEDGGVLITEGVQNNDLWMITAGAAEIIKRDDQTGSEHVVNRVERGAVLGEMSLFQQELASASVHATGRTQALVLPGSAMTRAHLGTAYDILRGNVGEFSMDRQRLTTERYVDQIRASLEQETQRREFGVLVSVIVILVGIDHAVAELSHRTSVDITSQSFSWGALLSFGVPLGYFVWRTGQPAAVFGVTTLGWRRAVRESLLIAPPLIAAAIAAKFLMMQFGVMDDGPLFTTRTFYSTAMFFPGIAGVIASRTLGFFHHATQELLMRGVVQGSLYRLYGRESHLSAIVATSAIFATAHLFIGIPLAVMTFAGGLFFGWLYSRHGTLIGVTVLHFILHTSMKFLGFL